MRTVTVKQDDLKKVVDYLWSDEEKHYEESDKPSDHIFRTLQTLKVKLEDDKRSNRKR